MVNYKVRNVKLNGSGLISHTQICAYSCKALGRFEQRLVTMINKENEFQNDEHPIDPAIRREIEATLARLEEEYSIKILFACESGSRGWGFASPDSDYDVRFIYVHKVEWYLTVLPGRDVIELPISDVYDVSTGSTAVSPVTIYVGL